MAASAQVLRQTVPAERASRVRAVARAAARGLRRAGRAIKSFSDATYVGPAAGVTYGRDTGARC